MGGEIAGRARHRQLHPTGGAPSKMDGRSALIL
jgi:hypothetical protein